MNAIIALVLIVGGLALYFATKEYNKMKSRWNDGCCDCGTGMLKFDRTDSYEEVGSLYVYKCTSCEVEESFLMKMHE